MINGSWAGAVQFVPSQNRIRLVPPTQGTGNERVSIEGYAQISGGNPGADKILTAINTSGDAVWKSASELGLDGGLTGGGTTNYIPKFTGTSALGNSQIFDSGINIGIGTTAPVEKIEVRDDTSGSARIRITDTVQNPELQFQYGTLSTDHWAIYNNQSDDSLRIWDGSDYLTILQNGNVGIGTVSPSIKLAIGDTDTGLEWISDGNLGVYTNNNERIRVTSGGRIGIGTNIPEATLDVNGAAIIRGGIYSKNAVSYFGHEDDGQNRLRIYRYPSTDSSYPNYALIANDTNGTASEGGYIYFQPGSLNRLMLYAPTGNTGIIDMYGQLKISSGSPAANKVLTAVDSTGLAEWKTREELRMGEVCVVGFEGDATGNSYDINTCTGGLPYKYDSLNYCSSIYAWMCTTVLCPIDYEAVSVGGSCSAGQLTYLKAGYRIDSSGTEIRSTRAGSVICKNGATANQVNYIQVTCVKR